jgi:hypothetical protein
MNPRNIKHKKQAFTYVRVASIEPSGQATYDHQEAASA